jgi:YidC/Oxa1 family membrane protein insertase
MEPRRIALAVVLMAAVLILTPYLFPTAKPVAGSMAVAADSLTADPQRDSVAAAAAARVGGSATTPVAGATPSADSLAPSVSAAPLPTIDTTLVKTALADYRTSSQGAALVGAAMTRYQALANRGRTKEGVVELAAPGDRLLSFRLVVPGDTIALDKQVFRTTESSANGVSTVRYETELAAAAGAARQVSISYSFQPDSYRVAVAAAVTGVPETSFLLVDLPRGFRSSEADTVEDHNHLAYAYKPELSSAKGVTFRSLDPGERRIEPGPIMWAVAKNKYFMLGVLTPQGGTPFVEADFTGGPRVAKSATRGEATLVMPLKAGNVAFEAYVGPQEFKRLVAMGREFETSNPYGGWIQGIVQPFATMVITLLLWMKKTLGVSYGWILVIFGVAVRIILWPLNQRAMRSSMQMQRIQPELQAIQARHKGDPQKLQAAMMQVYKEHGMSPFSSLSGCLPMLIPLPVFFALFFVFQNTIEFRGVSFLWFPDISVKDPYYIIPILVAITALVLSWLGMRGIKANEQQKMMMYLMPAMMLIFFVNMASGLNLYYFIQNLASLPQQWLISRERSKAAPLVRG